MKERGSRNRPRVVLRAALTVDGKLDSAALPDAAAEEDPTTYVLSDPAMLAALPAGVRQVICRGPAGAFRALLDAGRVDELELWVGLRVDGRRDAATLSGPPGADFFPASIECRLLKVERREDGCWLHYRVRQKAEGRGMQDKRERARQ